MSLGVYRSTLCTRLQLSCPPSHPWPYQSGSYCCEHDHSWDYELLKYDSRNCKDDAYFPCPHGKCFNTKGQANNILSSPGIFNDFCIGAFILFPACPRSHQYAHANGTSCCKHSTQQDGAPLDYLSDTCKDGDSLPCTTLQCDNIFNSNE